MRLPLKLHLGEMFQEQTMDKDVTAANFLQKDVFSRVVKETGVVPRNITAEVKDNAQVEMLNAGSPLGSCSIS